LLDELTTEMAEKKVVEILQGIVKKSEEKGEDLQKSEDDVVVEDEDKDTETVKLMSKTLPKKGNYQQKIKMNK